MPNVVNPRYSPSAYATHFLITCVALQPGSRHECRTRDHLMLPLQLECRVCKSRASIEPGSSILPHLSPDWAVSIGWIVCELVDGHPAGRLELVLLYPQLILPGLGPVRMGELRTGLLTHHKATLPHQEDVARDLWHLASLNAQWYESTPARQAMLHCSHFPNARLLDRATGQNRTAEQSRALQSDAEEEVALAVQEAVRLPDGEHGAEIGDDARLLRDFPFCRVPDDSTDLTVPSMPSEWLKSHSMFNGANSRQIQAGHILWANWEEGDDCTAYEHAL